jgi:hypothetical protein
MLMQYALYYHAIGKKGKLEVAATKLMGTKADLSGKPCWPAHTPPHPQTRPVLHGSHPTRRHACCMCA